MALCIAYTRDDGGVSIVNLSQQSRLEGETEAAWIARMKVTMAPAGGMVIDASTIPADRSTRAFLRIINGALTTDQTAAAATTKVRLAKQIDTDAEAIRLKYITPGAGMQLTYQEKFAQAQAVHGIGEAAANALDVTAREARFPTLSASVGIEAPTLWDCADLVLLRYAVFAQLSFTIEKTRLAGKKAINEAASVAAAETAYKAIDWKGL